MIIMPLPSQSRYHDLHGKGKFSPKRKEEGEEIKWTERETQFIEATSLNAFKSRLSKIHLSCFCKEYHF